MIIQISSGQGPAECELAVLKLFNALKAEFSDIELLYSRKSRFSEGCTSMFFSTESNLGFLDGSVQWICKSPLRPNHKRKNWFIDVSVIPGREEIEALKENDIRIESFRSGGHGGQNVNKVSTGIRITHLPTGIAVTSTAERSQYQNKQDALRKLDAVLRCMDSRSGERQRDAAWREHYRIERGNPIRIYEGTGFRLKK